MTSGSLYLTFKALHLVAMVAWFAGLFYMFRLFVYHCIHRDKPETTAVLKTMQRKLYKIISTPAMVVTVVFGFALLSQAPGVAKMGWFHIKLLCLLALIGYHFFIGYTLKRFAKDDLFLTEKQCRLWNEFPTLFLLAIILLAVFKPF